jgi:hypothetical protein
LTNIVRAEPPPDLFSVPSDYRVVDLRRIDEVKVHLEREAKKLEKARSGQE